MGTLLSAHATSRARPAVTIAAGVALVCATFDAERLIAHPRELLDFFTQLSPSTCSQSNEPTNRY